MINDELKNKVMEDITLLKYIGINPISVVHGGGPDISKALKKFDIESEFINGLRVTDEETMNVARMRAYRKDKQRNCFLARDKRAARVSESRV